MEINWNISKRREPFTCHCVLLLLKAVGIFIKLGHSVAHKL